MKVSIFNTDGKKSKNSVELNDEIFAIEPNEVVIYEDVRRIMAAKRQGTHSTKGRSEVTGSTKKLYRQGTVMHVEVTSNLHYFVKGNCFWSKTKKVYVQIEQKDFVQLARKSALSMKMASESILVTTDFTYETPSTKAVSAMLSAFELDVTILIAESDVNMFKSARNIPRVQVVVASSLNIKYLIVT